jgi:hypothetical protein
MIEYAPAIVGVMCVILALFVNRATEASTKGASDGGSKVVL